MKTILLFGFHDFAGSMVVYKLAENAKNLEIEVQNIEKKDYLCPLGVLSGVVTDNAKKTPFAAKSKPYEGEELPVRMLLFAGISQEELEQVLEICRQSGITATDLKAMLTPYNLTWNAVSLCQELVKEHEQMKRSDR